MSEGCRGRKFVTDVKGAVIIENGTPVAAAQIVASRASADLQIEQLRDLVARLEAERRPRPLARRETWRSVGTLSAMRAL